MCNELYRSQFSTSSRETQVSLMSFRFPLSLFKIVDRPELLSLERAFEIFAPKTTVTNMSLAWVIHDPHMIRARAIGSATQSGTTNSAPNRTMNAQRTNSPRRVWTACSSELAWAVS